MCCSLRQYFSFLFVIFLFPLSCLQLSQWCGSYCYPRISTNSARCATGSSPYNRDHRVPLWPREYYLQVLEVSSCYSWGRCFQQGWALGCFSVSRWFGWMCDGWSDVLAVRKLNLLFNCIKPILVSFLGRAALLPSLAEIVACEAAEGCVESWSHHGLTLFVQKYFPVPNTLLESWFSVPTLCSECGTKTCCLCSCRSLQA